MAEQEFQDSVYRFTDPIRYFKANDPYYFEIDNIPLKQLQENCNWLKDQLRQVTPELRKIKRADLDELRPYATGGDRVIRVKPGRYTARVNDASTRTPLSFLTQALGGEIGDTDSYRVTVPNNVNTVLDDILDKFKSSLAEDALGMNGLESRLFTWPVFSVDSPIDNDGVDLDTSVNFIKYGGVTVNNPGAKVVDLAAVISQSIAWARGTENSFTLFTLDGNVEGSDGFALLPRLESHFVKYWRGVARTAVVDVEDELTIEVPAFDANDFSYVDENGNTQAVDGVASRIDLVFIYTAPVDTGSTTILKPSGKEVITKPQLGIVRGAGIRAKYEEISDIAKGRIEYVTDEHKIMAAPGDSDGDSNIGFTATSANDIAFDVRGSFPAPDDILNLAPLISEKLEDNAIELVGQSILPVAYVWVKNEGDNLTNGSVPILTTDVIDIRPFFRTTELAYNERTGIAAAMPQLSLANPAVGKAQLDSELQRQYKDVISRIQQVRDLIPIIDSGDDKVGIIDSLVGDLTINLEEPLVFFAMREDLEGSNQFLTFNNGVDENISNSDVDYKYRFTSPIDFRGVNVDLTPALLARTEITELLGIELQRISEVKVTLLVKAGWHGVAEAGGGGMISFYVDGDFRGASPDAPLAFDSLLETSITTDRESMDNINKFNQAVTNSMRGLFPISKYTKYCIGLSEDSEQTDRQAASFTALAEVPVFPINNRVLVHAVQNDTYWDPTYASYMAVEGIRITRY